VTISRAWRCGCFGMGNIVIDLGDCFLWSSFNLVHFLDVDFGNIERLFWAIWRVAHFQNSSLIHTSSKKILKKKFSCSYIWPHLSACRINFFLNQQFQGGKGSHCACYGSIYLILYTSNLCHLLSFIELLQVCHIRIAFMW